MELTQRLIVALQPAVQDLAQRHGIDADNALQAILDAVIRQVHETAVRLALQRL